LAGETVTVSGTMPTTTFGDFDKTLIAPGTSFTIATNGVIATGELVTDEGALTAGGTLTTTGSGAILVSGGVFTVAATGLTLSGGGFLSMSNLSTNIVEGAAASATLTNVNDRIFGAGQLGDGKMALVNDTAGVIEDATTTALTIDTGTNTVTNAGDIESTGTGGVTITGALANTGLLLADGGGTLKVEGAVTGAGTVKISGATADFGSTFSENVDFTGTTGELELAKSQSYAGAITGFATAGGTSLDLLDIAYSGSATATYSGTSTSGVLTVKSGSETATIKLDGDYLSSRFVLSSDGHGGTTVVDPAKGAAPHLTSPPHQFVGAMASLGANAGAAHEAAEAWRAPAPAILTAPRMTQAP
jgi:hypothetical protein